MHSAISASLPFTVSINSSSHASQSIIMRRLLAWKSASNSDAIQIWNCSGKRRSGLKSALGRARESWERTNLGRGGRGGRRLGGVLVGGLLVRLVRAGVCGVLGVRRVLGVLRRSWNRLLDSFLGLLLLVIRFLAQTSWCRSPCPPSSWNWSSLVSGSVVSSTSRLVVCCWCGCAACWGLCSPETFWPFLPLLTASPLLPGCAACSDLCSLDLRRSCPC